MSLTCVYLLNGAVLHQYCSCRVLTFNYYGLPLKPLLMRCQVSMVSGPPNWIVVTVSGSFVCSLCHAFVPVHISSHTQCIHVLCIHRMMYVHCRTCKCIGDRTSPNIGYRASSNKLNTLMTVQCNEIVACNVYTYIHKWCEVCYPQLFKVHTYVRTSHFKSSANESISPLIHAQLHRTCQHSEPKFHVRLWFPNVSYLILTVSS